MRSGRPAAAVRPGAPVNPIFAAALQVEDVCRIRRWRFCFIGGLAVLRWGEPRLTRDVDLTLIVGYGGEATFVDALLERFTARVGDAREFALRNRVVLVSASNGVPIDVALGALPFEERAAARSSPFAIGEDLTLRTCSAEDLVVHKVFAGRERDWLDVEGVIVRQGPALDQEIVWKEVLPLLELKDATGDAERLQGLFERDQT